MNSYTIRDENGSAVVICDSEILYAAHLAEYLHSISRLPYKVQIFSGIELMQSCIPAEKVALLVIAESLYTDALQEKGYHKLLILNESEKIIGNQENMSKFQQVETIADKIYALCMDEAGGFSTIRHGAPMKLIGVYSPVRDIVTSASSACLAELISQSVSALYVTLEPYASPTELFDTRVEGTLQDLLYYNACAKEKFASQLHFMTGRAGELGILPPADPWIQTSHIGEDRWREFITSIEQVTDYRYMILELSEVVDGLLEILRLCDHVITYTYGDSMSQSKMHKYTELLKTAQYEDIYIKTKIIEISEMMRVETFESGLTPEIREELRKLMKGQAEEILDGR